jgi:hypothetical protein
MFIEIAPIRFNVGQVFQNRKSPSKETIANTIASDRHHVLGMMKPRNPKKDARKPTVERIQKILLTILSVDPGTFGRIHEEDGIQNPSE